MKIDALGFVEARGFITAIVAADAMVKAASVKLIRQHQVDPRFITLVVAGDLAACRAAVDAGVAAGSRVGEIVSRLEIGRPDDDTGRMVLDLIARSKEDPKPSGATPAAAPSPAKPQSAPAAAAKAATPTKKLPAVKPVAIAAKAAEPSPVLTEILAFIGEKPKGRTWMEIANRFPKNGELKKTLDEMVAGGKLRKTGNRYLKPSE